MISGETKNLINNYNVGLAFDAGNEDELIKSLDEIAFEQGTSNIRKLETMQNLLYQYEQIQTHRSMAESFKSSKHTNAEEEYFKEGFRR